MRRAWRTALCGAVALVAVLASAVPAFALTAVAWAPLNAYPISADASWTDTSTAGSSMYVGPAWADYSIAADGTGATDSRFVLSRTPALTKPAGQYAFVVYFRGRWSTDYAQSSADGALADMASAIQTAVTPAPVGVANISSGAYYGPGVAALKRAGEYPNGTAFVSTGAATSANLRERSGCVVYARLASGAWRSAHWDNVGNPYTSRIDVAKGAGTMNTLSTSPGLYDDLRLLRVKTTEAGLVKDGHVATELVGVTFEGSAYAVETVDGDEIAELFQVADNATAGNMPDYSVPGAFSELPGEDNPSDGTNLDDLTGLDNLGDWESTLDGLADSLMGFFWPLDFVGWVFTL